MNKNIILASLAGGFVGVTTALLFAPKSGSQLIETMYRPFAPFLRQALPQLKKSYKKVKAAASPMEVHRTKAKGAKSHAAAKTTTARRSPVRKKSSQSSTESKGHNSSSSD
ncbi:MAG: YtxH domain-containing protein [Candidatus Protochlamydia sp.]|nr:YtxH domain-containing protein [Candidatus Protochlamydia sp.]